MISLRSAPRSFWSHTFLQTDLYVGVMIKEICEGIFLYNATLAHRFWLSWMQSYLPPLQGRNKWRTLKDNLVQRQLVFVGDAEDIAHKGAYRLGRMVDTDFGGIHCLHQQTRKGKEIVRRATVAVIAKKNTSSDSSKIEYVLRNISKIALV